MNCVVIKSVKKQNLFHVADLAKCIPVQPAQCDNSVTALYTPGIISTSFERSLPGMLLS